jgi:hypothetical protein
MLTKDAMDFLQGQPGGMLCSRSDDNQPYAHECFTVRCTGDTFSGYVPVRFAQHLEENLRGNGQVSVVTSQTFGSHRSVQIKGRATLVSGPKPEPERIGEAVELIIAFVTQWMPEAKAREMFAKFMTEECYYFEATLEQVFDQTPGPRAGQKTTAEPA